MRQRLISANELEDMFYWGKNDMAITGDGNIDGLVLDIIRQQPTIKAVPFFEIVRAIIKIGEINSNYDYVKRQDVIDALWNLIGVENEAQEAKEAADGV